MFKKLSEQTTITTSPDKTKDYIAGVRNSTGSTFTNWKMKISDFLTEIGASFLPNSLSEFAFFRGDNTNTPVEWTPPANARCLGSDSLGDIIDNSSFVDYDCIVGTGLTFETIFQAVDAGNKKIKLVSDTIEDGDWSEKDLQIFADIKTDGSLYEIDLTGARCYNGAGILNQKFKNVRIVSSYAQVSTDTLFGDSVTSSGTIECDNVEFINSGECLTGIASLNTYFIGKKLSFYTGNVTNCLFQTKDFDELNIIGGGTSNDGKVATAWRGYGMVKNLNISGTFFDQFYGSNQPCINYGIVEKITDTTTPFNVGEQTAAIFNAGQINSGEIKTYYALYNASFFPVATLRNAKVTGTTSNGTSTSLQNVFENVEFTYANAFFYWSASPTNIFKNCKIPSTAILIPCTFSRCDFSANVSFDSNNNVVDNNCTFAGNLTNTGDANTFDNSRVIGSCTNDATADKANFTNMRTTAAIVDNGTNTILANNQTI